MKYYGVCYDTSPDLDGDDYVSLDDAYKSDAWRYLAYYTLTKSPKFCAGTGTAPGSSDIMSAVSDAFWYTSLVPSTVHDIMTGIQYWIDHPGNKANIAHSAGMKWSSLDYMYGDYSENQAGTIFVRAAVLAPPKQLGCRAADQVATSIKRKGKPCATQIQVRSLKPSTVPAMRRANAVPRSIYGTSLRRV